MNPFTDRPNYYPSSRRPVAVKVTYNLAVMSLVQMGAAIGALVSKPIS